MNALEVNKAIAEAVGFSDLQDNTNWFTRPDGEKQFYNALETHWSELIPNYFYSLDACAQFEATINVNEFYLKHLEASIPWDGGAFQLVTATAPQRCQAFLRMRGLYKCK